MKFIKHNLGQIGMWTVIISAIGSIFVAGITGYFTKSGAVSAEVEIAKTEQRKDNLALVSRVTAGEVKVDNLQKDVGEIKQDVKSLLKLLK